jgi:hypothetical protein
VVDVVNRPYMNVHSSSDPFLLVQEGAGHDIIFQCERLNLQIVNEVLGTIYHWARKDNSWVSPYLNYNISRQGSTSLRPCPLLWESWVVVLIHTKTEEFKRAIAPCKLLAIFVPRRSWVLRLLTSISTATARQSGFRLYYFFNIRSPVWLLADTS